MALAGVLLLLFDYLVVGFAFETAVASSTEEGEEECGDESSDCGAASTVDGEFGGVGEVVPLLTKGKSRSLSFGDSFCNGGVTALGFY